MLSPKTLLIVSVLIAMTEAESSPPSLPVRVFGAFENVPERESPNFVTDFASKFPGPKGYSWPYPTYAARTWISQQKDEIMIVCFADPVVKATFKFRLNEQKNATQFGTAVEYNFKLLDGPDQESTTLLQEMKTPEGTFTILCVFEANGMKVTYKLGEKEASRYYRRILPFLFDGTYENVPEKSENWEEFISADKSLPRSHSDIKTIQFYRDRNTKYDVTSGLYSNASYYNRVIYASGYSVEFPFGITPDNRFANRTELALPDGSLLKYSYTFTGGAKNVLRTVTEVVGSGKKIEVEATLDFAGIYVVYRRDSMEAKRFYRRVIPASVLGVYESNPDNEQFIAFATAIRSPELLQKTTIEVAENPDHTYVQRFTTGSEPTVDFPFVLGQHSVRTMKGRTVEYTYRYLDEAKPILSTSYQEKDGGPLKFDVIGVYGTDGYTATYLFGDRLASRTYTRKSPKAEVQA
ncbi:hypothetical protein BV898_01512 [Hypsibius exemplaris]|uniref:Uncharacterized protein n=1 Tax=Hypsibius exemplaris TaxID=2072580 RepID=A0A1W0XAM0_HYPEX|nr:hypothetical protein BV898_01512 [Hypsibius exemplaris]